MHTDLVTLCVVEGSPWIVTTRSRAEDSSASRRPLMPARISCSGHSFFPSLAGQARSQMEGLLAPVLPASNLLLCALRCQVLPIIVFFSCIMSVLYYLGLMQWVILKVSYPHSRALPQSPALRDHILSESLAFEVHVLPKSPTLRVHPF